MSSGEISRLKERIAKLETKLEARDQNQAQLFQPSLAIMPDPPIFRGRLNGIPFEEWACMISLKLGSAPIKDLDDKTKILFVATHTSGDAFDVVKSRLPIISMSAHTRAGYQPIRPYTTTDELLIDLKKRYANGDCVVQ